MRGMLRDENVGCQEEFAGEDSQSLLDRELGWALFGVPLLFAVIPVALGFANNANVAVLDRFAEEIVGVNINRGILIGQIEGAIWLGCYGESRKLVPADFDGRGSARVFVAAFAEGGLNAISAEPRLSGICQSAEAIPKAEVST